MQAIPLGNYRCTSSGRLMGVIKFIPTYMEDCADIYMTQYGEYVYPTEDGTGLCNLDGLTLVQLNRKLEPAIAM